MANRYLFKTTFLLQYDALIDPDYTGLLQEQDHNLIEIGAWLEIVQPLVEEAGLTWRGRQGYSWDYHSHVGFLIGYSPEEREILLDLYMNKFRDVFGYYPPSVGSWFIDAHSLAYLKNRYQVEAACICRDQWGTDGYNLWGGYYSGAYYPSKHNMLAPAQGSENQIDIPVFRMLGSDPLHQYDLGLSTETGFNPLNAQDVSTMEPVYPESGGNPQWVGWFLKENFNELAQPFGYAQVGQENSFGWDRIGNGLSMQMELLAAKIADGGLVLQHLSETGRKFRQEFNVTPTTTVGVQEDWTGESYQSVWYCSRFYRVNVYAEGERFWIRDIHLFADDYAERYLNDVCKQEQSFYDNLPIVDGYRWSGNGIRSGLYPMIREDNGDFAPMIGELIAMNRTGNDFYASYRTEAGEFTIKCEERHIEFICESAEDWILSLSWGSDESPILSAEFKTCSYIYNGFSYSLYAEHGSLKLMDTKELQVYPEHGKITLLFGREENS
ncbi:hypothetical protein [Paenibacillus prosopidis]|nr:hypothetical protein [Paenibacillus prosopidis]